MRAVVAHIEAHPETYDQMVPWHSECGTLHCFAGKAQILSGKYAERINLSWVPSEYTYQDARVWLDLNSAECCDVFWSHATLEGICRLIDQTERLHNAVEMAPHAP